MKKRGKRQPKPPVPTWKTVDIYTLYEGQILMEFGKTRIIVSQLELEYDYCYYEGDIPSVNAKIETQILS
jgi:hypothetical protein